MASADSQALTRSFRSSANLSKSTRLNVPPFLQKLYEMVNDTSNNSLIRWSDGGDSFLVLDHERFAHEVLGRWFKHQNFQSFVRQLNMYGFHKIPSLQQGVLRSENDTEIWNFEHPHFRQNQPDLLCLISRKKQASQQPNAAGAIEANVEEVAAPATPSSATGGSGPVLDLNQIVTGIHAIKRHQQTISADLNELKASNQALWQEVMSARERHTKQQDMINRILKFLGSVFGRQDPDAKNHRRDRVTPSPPLMAQNNQRFMIRDVEQPKRSVEVVEVDADPARSPTNSSKSDSDLPTFAHIDTPSVTSPATETNFDLTPASEAPPSFYVDPKTSSSMQWAQNALPQSQTPFPTMPPNSAQLELHRTPSSQPGPLSLGDDPPAGASGSASSQDNLLQTAFHQLVNSPTQLQRFMDALNASSASSPAPQQPSLPAPTPTLQPSNPIQAYTPSTNYPPLDYSQFNSDLANSLLPPDHDTTAALAALANNSREQTARTYRDAQEINHEVETMNESIRTLIENMGFDASMLADSSSADADTAAATPAPADSAGDFDFDAFLSTFSTPTLPGGTLGDGDPVASAELADEDMDQSGITAFMDDVAADPTPRAKAQAQAQAAAVGARKRRSDAAEFGAVPPPLGNGPSQAKKAKT